MIAPTVHVSIGYPTWNVSFISTSPPCSRKLQLYLASAEAGGEGGHPGSGVHKYFSLYL